MNKQERRSRVMRAVKRSGTQLEARFEDLLRTAELHGYECQVRDLPGTPDFLYREKRVVFFVDSCFWHGCPQHLRRPGTNTAYWTQKIMKNQERDACQTEELRKLGWRVERIWEHELRESANLVERLKLAVRGS
jgi:DNA mismatch endonuclease, patch repair protein